MDELEISGKSYISSRKAAEIHKYHVDYIGQLIRGGKVPGQKVGRAWYIDADALATYLGKEVPAKGPMKKEEPELVPETPLQVVRGVEEVTITPKVTRASREHVIAALEVKGKNIVHPQPVENNIEKIVEDAFEAQFDNREEVPTPITEERTDETYIPLKISEEVEPKAEDSFYKVSRSGLRYMSEGAPVIPRVQQKSTARDVPQMYATVAPSAPMHVTKPAVRAKSASNVARAMGAVALAGVLSLAVLGVFSYYLQSVVSVNGNGQTSLILLSE